MYEIVYHSPWGEEVIDRVESLTLAREKKFEYSLWFTDGYITWRYKPGEKQDDANGGYDV